MENIYPTQFNGIIFYTFFFFLYIIIVTPMTPFTQFYYHLPVKNRIISYTHRDENKKKNQMIMIIIIITRLIDFMNVAPFDIHYFSFL